MISPLAIFSNDPEHLRIGKTRSLPVGGLVVHTTGSGPAISAKKLGIPPVERALAYYLHGDGGFPHYLIDYDGDLFAICDEDQTASHAGWAKIGGYKAWKGWKPSRWWKDIWARKLIGIPTPLVVVQSIDSWATTPNAIYLGCELLADGTGYGFTDQQYLKLAMLWADLCARYGFLKPHLNADLPCVYLLGHQDVNPIERATSKGPWDPGPPDKFSWSRLQAEILKCGLLP